MFTHPSSTTGLQVTANQAHKAMPSTGPQTHGDTCDCIHVRTCVPACSYTHPPTYPDMCLYTRRHLCLHTCPHLCSCTGRYTCPHMCAHTCRANHIGQPHRPTLPTASVNHIGQPPQSTTSANHISQPQRLNHTDHPHRPTTSHTHTHTHKCVHDRCLCTSHRNPFSWPHTIHEAI